MSKYKYSLIISQYYHSRHSFIVKLDNETFLENSKKFAVELMEYKRGSECKRDIYLGDLASRDTAEICSRYNINDSGDIYFIQSIYANYCKDVAIEYAEDSRRETVGFKRKEVIQSISKDHCFKTVKSIVEKYFEIA